jgi:hypothetical protein
MNGTTPPWEITTSPRSLFSLWTRVRTRITSRGKSSSLLVVADGELQVPGHDTLFLVVPCGVASKLKNLGSEVFQDGGEVDYPNR